MSKKKVSFKQQGEQSSLPVCSLPQKLNLKNVTNHCQPAEITSLRGRIEELQMKVNELQSKMRLKRKRIRRKSNEVQKKHRCQYCRKLYGSLVSLNLHLRIKHRKQKEGVEKQSENSVLQGSKVEMGQQYRQ